ncbi:MAG: small multi-drug export protein [Clostridiales bacterium]|nr:small multi-drug export protein [Clostridiales bacterium]
MVDFIRQMLEGLGAETTVLIMSMIPVVELRGAIPVGMALGLSTYHSTILSFLGSMTPVPFILFGVRPVFELLRKTKLFDHV